MLGKDQACVEGTVERIVYESPESGFLVGRLRPQEQPGIMTFVGNLLAISPGETVRLWGRWVDDKKFGRQLRVERYESVLPATIKGMEKYLGSGLVRGVGPTYAKRLVDAFGIETLRVIEEQPRRLESVPGIGRKRAKQIREAWAAQRAIQSIMLFLQGHGIGVTQAVKIYKRYGDTAMAVLRDNPYRLAEDIAGIAFKKADAVASELGIGKDSPKRAEAGLVYTLQEAAAEGHVFLPRETLFAKTAGLLEVDEALFCAPLDTLAELGTVEREGESVFLKALHAAETACDHGLKRVIASPADAVPIQVDKAIAWVEKTQHISLSGEQQQAIRTAVEAKVAVVTGGPGTGKTTLINGFVGIFEKKGLQIRLAAPTGRAAKRLEAATGREAKTIHRLLEYSPKHGGFTRDETNPLDGDLVIIDEMSMVDIYLMTALVKAMPPHARLFLVGDVDQLPSVGPGNVLMDIIASGVVPVVWLKTVFRQAAESGIITNAHKVNQGRYPEFNSKDFFFVERLDPAQALDTVIELVTSRIPRKFGMDPLHDVQVLAPMHRGDIGVARLNEELQQALNPHGEPVPHRNFRVGDKVMQLRNNYELDVYNGDIGRATLVDPVAQEVQVDFEDRAVLYKFEDLDELTLAYAATVHKSQGSEYPAVVIPVLVQHYVMLQRNVLYTAITRAGKLAVLVGDPKALRRALGNTEVSRRNTRLADRLRNAV